MTVRTVLFDLDGTLANNDHRQSLVTGGRKDWEAFFEAQAGDKPNEAVVELYKALVELDRFDVLVVTARPERYRESSERWFQTHKIPVRRLLMRADGDRRSDSVVKREILLTLKREGATPLFVVDDRKAVVDMWRREGVVCLQCADHDF